jgi:hypothetical protein
VGINVLELYLGFLEIALWSFERIPVRSLYFIGYRGLCGIICGV